MATSAEPLPPHLQRALLYIKLANDGGYQPTASELDQYAIRNQPAGPCKRLIGASALQSALDQLGGYVTEGAPVSEYMRQVGWVQRRADGLGITALGVALATGLGAEAPTKAEERGVVLNPDDPAKYEHLVRALAGARGGMLADPYLSPDIFDLLAEGTSLRRLLISQKVKAVERTLFALGLSRFEASSGRPLEIRWSEDARFHDRYLLHEDGTLDIIGASLNGLHKNITALVPLPAVAQDPLRTFVEEVWDRARTIEPRDPLIAQPVETPGVDDPGPPD